MVVDPAGPLCLCGKRGCRATGFGTALPNESVYSTRLRGTSGDNLEAIAGQIVSQAATQGDELANARTGWLGVGVGIGVANLMNPQRFVLGGGVTKAGARFWEVVPCCERRPCRK